MGLPGSGKTTLAMALKVKLEEHGKTVTWLNADHVRQSYNDWDFSYEGRIRQSVRMSDLASVTETDFVIADFVAPLQQMRTIFNADYVIWMDTIKKSIYEDTNRAFDEPTRVSMRITEQDAEKWAEIIGKILARDPNEQISYQI